MIDQFNMNVSKARQAYQESPVTSYANLITALLERGDQLSERGQKMLAKADFLEAEQIAKQFGVENPDIWDRLSLFNCSTEEELCAKPVFSNSGYRETNCDENLASGSFRQTRVDYENENRFRTYTTPSTPVGNSIPNKKSSGLLIIGIVLVIFVFITGAFFLIRTFFPEILQGVTTSISEVINTITQGITNQPQDAESENSENQQKASQAEEPTTSPQVASSPEPQSLSFGDSYTRSIDGMLMVAVPEGYFTMGTDDPSVSSEERPTHQVYLESFWMDAYEVSNVMYKIFVNETGYITQAEQQGYSYIYGNNGGWEAVSGVNWQYPMEPGAGNSENLPVVHVSYYDAAAYCNWAGGRLPTEAEWEKAARGTDERLYPWGNIFSASNLRYNSSGGPVDVMSFPNGVSPYGVFNMAGNVFEWTGDWYAADYYSSSPESNPTGPSTGDYKVLRGGAWINSQNNVRTTHRDISGPDYMNYLLGFRCVVTP